MGNNSIKFLMILAVIYTISLHGNDATEMKLFKATKTDNFCRTITFKGMNVDIYNEYGQTPLMVAAQYNNSRFIDCLRKAHVDVWLKDNDDKTAIQYLKKPQTQTEKIYSIRTYNALRALDIYQIIGDTAGVVQMEIDLKKRIFNFWIEGALCEEFTIPKDIKCFVREKKDRSGTRATVYEKDVDRGVPPIFAAIQNHLYKTLTEILNDGGDIEMKYKGVAPLMFSVYQHDDKLVKIILEYGANPNFLNTKGFYSPLSEACVTNKVSIVKLLLKYGADVNYQYNKSETALTVASKECKNFELVKLLLDNGANPKIMDRFGHNTLTGLKRYCQDIVAYRKMKKFIEWNSL